MKNLIIFVLFFCVLQEIKAQQAPTTENGNIIPEEYELNWWRGRVFTAFIDGELPIKILIENHPFGSQFRLDVQIKETYIYDIFHLDSILQDTSEMIGIEEGYGFTIQIEKKGENVKFQYTDDSTNVNGSFRLPPCPEFKYMYRTETLSWSAGMYESYNLYPNGYWHWQNKKTGQKKSDDVDGEPIWFYTPCPEMPKK